MTINNLIEADDIVLHRPSGETWVVCGVDYGKGKLVPCGYPFPSLANLGDCELISKGHGQSADMRRALTDHGMLGMIARKGY